MQNPHASAAADNAPAPFLVTCCGQAGAIWLGAALNKHPDILCTSGTDHPLMAMNYDYNEDEIVKIRAGIKSPADVRYGVNEGLADVLKQGGFFTYGSAHGQKDKHGDVFLPMDNFSEREAFMSYMFDELDTLPKFKNYKAYGNVRGMTASQCASELKKGAAAFNGRGSSFPIADLTRDPIVRLETTVHFCEEMYDTSPSYKKAIDDEIANNPTVMAALETDYNADFSTPFNRAFLYVELMTHHTLQWAQDIRNSPEIPRILFETLRSDRDYFSTFVDYITGGRVEADDAYLGWIFDPANVDSGRISKHNRKRRAAREIYESWPAWQQEHISRTFQAFDIAAVYEPYGYDFSYLRNV